MKKLGNIYELSDGRFFVHWGEEIPYSYEVNGTTINSHRTNDKFYLFNNEGLEKSILNNKGRPPQRNEDTFAENNGKINYSLNFNCECHIIDLNSFKLEKLIKENYVGALSFYKYEGKLYFSTWEESLNEFPGFIFLNKKDIQRIIIRDNVIIIMKTIPNGKVYREDFYFVYL